jgi:hypothetical protein
VVGTVRDFYCFLKSVAVTELKDFRQLGSPGRFLKMLVGVSSFYLCHLV